MGGTIVPLLMAYLSVSMERIMGRSDGAHSEGRHNTDLQKKGPQERRIDGAHAAEERESVTLQIKKSPQPVAKLPQRTFLCTAASLGL